MAPLDNTANFDRQAVTASVGTTDPETISVTDASALPDPSTDQYNVVIWDAGSHSRPDQDANVEILRVTARDTANDTITVDRGQENTTNASHPSSSEIISTQTAKYFDDIETFLNELADFTASPTEVTAPVNNGSVTTDELSHTANTSGSKSVNAALADGYVVAQWYNGETKTYDPSNYSTEDGAVQQAVDDNEAAASNNQGAEIHVPMRSSLVGGNPRFQWENTVTHDSGREIDFYIHSPNSNEGVVFTGNISGNTPAIRFDGVRGNVYVGRVVFGAGNDGTLVEWLDTTGLFWGTEVFGQGGEIIRSKGSSFDGWVFCREFDNSSGTTPIKFEDNANGDSPSDWNLMYNCPADDYDRYLYDTAGASPQIIAGHFEGAQHRAGFDFEGGGNPTIGPNVKIETGGSSRGAGHGIYHATNGDDNLKLLIGQIGNVDGDGIHIAGNGAGLIGPQTNFKGIGGDDINLTSQPNAVSVVPYPGNTKGTVSYPSPPRPRTRHPDGKFLLKQGTDTINAGATTQVESFASGGGGSPEYEMSVTVKPPDTIASDAAVSHSLGLDAGNDQGALWLTEELGNTSITVDWKIYGR